MFDSYTSESMSDLTPEKAEELQAYYDKGAGMDLKAQEDYDEMKTRIATLNKLAHPELDGACYICGINPTLIKQLMADEFEKAKIEQTELIRNRFVRDGWEYKWLTEIIDELRQKLEEWKK